MYLFPVNMTLRMSRDFRYQPEDKSTRDWLNQLSISTICYINIDVDR